MDEENYCDIWHTLALKFTSSQFVQSWKEFFLTRIVADFVELAQEKRLSQLWTNCCRDSDQGGHNEDGDDEDGNDDDGSCF